MLKTHPNTGNPNDNQRYNGHMHRTNTMRKHGEKIRAHKIAQ